ncbi:hypothetical protein I4641_11045 [Waterburya agarophytonicola K14]|uniref:Uncharacterized protein n=1 Tax=Waterburya agarophytonicola KI4 TaxID=2874699 RepID=A0A964BQ34_9CYAN|nr:hypothetical protein [Waterburya agarophytonicola]MCC0177514.1 hypothetical protein [Waterburya agarophytonicola KI4]
MFFGQTIVDLSGSNFNLDNPESWLILIMYVGFWVYSYYALVVFLIHTRQQNRLTEEIDLEENSPDVYF